MVDDVRKLNEICDRLAFNASMKKLTEKLPSDIRAKFQVPASIDFINS